MTNIAAPLPFIKMHGLGNDFVIIDGRANNLAVTEKFLRSLSDRRRGIGCDQIVIFRPSAKADIRLEMYNADGSPLGACGNATRCVAQLMFAELSRKTCIIETASGLLSAWEETPGQIAVDFGPPLLEWAQIPLAQATDTLHVPLALDQLSDPCCVSMGNPHAVFFVADSDAVPLAELGPRLEHHPIFPERCNIEAAQILAPDKIRMRVWERGTGITQACGSGACATLVAAARRGLSGRRATLILDGGDLSVEWREDNHVIMIGPATFSYSGVLPEGFGN